MIKGWIGFDLDGTLAIYYPSSWDCMLIGKPIATMVEKAQAYHRLGYEIRIFTARVACSFCEGNCKEKCEAAIENKQVRNLIEDWGEFVLGFKVKATCVKDYEMIMLYDDRCTQVITNMGRIVEKIS